MSSSLRILHLEDDRKDAEIIQGVLEGDGLACEVTRVEVREEVPGSPGHPGFEA